MVRYKCIVAYDGTQFAGYQVQPNKRTVQWELEKTLSSMHKGEEIKVFASGRTDAGVHAMGQVIHFDSILNLPEDRWLKALNAMLPADIAILGVEETEEVFHARFNSVRKEYRYKLSLSKTRDPFSRNYAWHYPYNLDISLMRQAAEQLIGTHDFTSFCSAKTEVKDKIRTVEEISFILENDQLTIRFIGNGFLYNMVRIMTGTLIEIGSGKRKLDEIESILNAKDRTKAGKTAPGQGLYLWKVDYK